MVWGRKERIQSFWAGLECDPNTLNTNQRNMGKESPDLSMMVVHMQPWTASFGKGQSEKVQKKDNVGSEKKIIILIIKRAWYKCSHIYQI